MPARDEQVLLPGCLAALGLAVAEVRRRYAVRSTSWSSSTAAVTAARMSWPATGGRGRSSSTPGASDWSRAAGVADVVRRVGPTQRPGAVARDHRCGLAASRRTGWCARSSSLVKGRTWCWGRWTSTTGRRTRRTSSAGGGPSTGRPTGTAMCTGRTSGCAQMPISPPAGSRAWTGRGRHPGGDARAPPGGRGPLDPRADQRPSVWAGVRRLRRPYRRAGLRGLAARRLGRASQGSGSTSEEFTKSSRCRWHPVE